MSDRLIRLSMTRAALRQRALVERAVREDRADIIAALWSAVDWQVAMQPS